MLDDTKLQTVFNYVEHKGVEMDPEVFTEQTGYYTIDEMVDRMVSAGQRLMAYRHAYDEEEFDGMDEEEAVNIYGLDPTESAYRFDRRQEMKRIKAAREAKGVNNVQSRTEESSEPSSQVHSQAEDNTEAGKSDEA